MVVRKIHLPFGDIFSFESLIKDIRSRNRFTPSKSSQYLVSQLIEYARLRRHCVLAEGQVFHRARIHPFNPEELSSYPLPPEEMNAPPAEKTKGGRLNPEGIPYLYIATNEATAIAEVRPWQRAAVSVATLYLVRDVNVVDFCRPTLELPPATEPEDWEKGQEFTWGMVGDSFSIPHHQEDSLRYLPTQFLAEAFKAASFDGIRYESALSPSGQNIALFDCALAKVQIVRRAKVMGVNYKHEWNGS
ncbi:MAG: RES family NAD+ phosphorylase [Nitrospira sp.]|nr:RES family NAD+ phosphorylase [Nitrospira sp.]